MRIKGQCQRDGRNINDTLISCLLYTSTAAAYLMHPELFADNVKGLCVSDQDLETGYLRMEEDEMNGGWKAGIKALSLIHI